MLWARSIRHELSLLLLNWNYSAKCSAFCFYLLFHQLVATIISLSFVDKGGKHYCLRNIKKLQSKSQVLNRKSVTIQFKLYWLLWRAFQCCTPFKGLVERRDSISRTEHSGIEGLRYRGMQFYLNKHWKYLMDYWNNCLQKKERRVHGLDFFAS